MACGLGYAAHNILIFINLYVLDVNNLMLIDESIFIIRTLMLIYVCRMMCEHHRTCMFDEHETCVLVAEMM